MGLTAKQFAEKYGVKDQRKVKKWFESGYLIGATKNENTGIYDIPEDTPLPYNADCRITRNQALWREMLDVASTNQSLYPAMYPKLPEGAFEEQLNQLRSLNLLTILQTTSGVNYLSLCPAGEKYMNDLSGKERRKALASVERFMATSAAGVTIIQAFCMAWPHIQSFLIK